MIENEIEVVDFTLRDGDMVWESGFSEGRPYKIITPAAKDLELSGSLDRQEVGDQPTQDPIEDSKLHHG